MSVNIINSSFQSCRSSDITSTPKHCKWLYTWTNILSILNCHSHSFPNHRTAPQSLQRKACDGGKVDIYTWNPQWSSIFIALAFPKQGLFQSIQGSSKGCKGHLGFGVFTCYTTSRVLVAYIITSSISFDGYGFRSPFRCCNGEIVGPHYNENAYPPKDSEW